MSGRQVVPQTSRELSNRILRSGFHAHAIITGTRVFGWKVAYRSSKKCGTYLCLDTRTGGNSITV